MARMQTGRPYPIGPQVDARGANFALFSTHAEKVELCLFDDRGRREIERIPLPENTDGIWHGYLPGAYAGLLYGYRIHGPYAPQEGHRFNPHKLLLDPYAREIVGTFHINDLHFGYRVGAPRADLVMDRRDNARVMPKCRLVDESFAWGDDRPPRHQLRDTVIYEMHIGGFTRAHPDIPAPLRGSFAALRQRPVIDHLRRLGITAVEFLPVHAWVDDRHLVERNMRNYWGYNSISFFAPEPRYLGSAGSAEFKHTVAALHAAGIEVILDVVYNHTAEGSELGPTLCFRGIDNMSYYWLSPESPRHCMDFTGCGNSLRVTHPRVLQMVVDSLRYWVEVMHVDGFRFDLAATLARGPSGFDRDAPFLGALAQDPVLARVKLIAEPWDLGEGGYRVGEFPPGWSEWNDRYRDTMRHYWRGDGGIIGEVAKRLSASADLYRHDRRRPSASVNFIAAHDGFTLNDLVTYNDKHNERNGEENNDGTNENATWNCGVEGPTDDEGVIALRQRQRRNLVATLLLSQGVPMLLAGDEVGNSQGGNNNAYCQDNEIGWIDWSGRNVSGQDLTDFIARLIALRRGCNLSHGDFLEGRIRNPIGHKDIAWFRADGQEMTESDWHFPDARFLAVAVDGTPTPALILLNAHFEPLTISVPQANGISRWRIEVDTTQPNGVSHRTLTPGESFELAERALLMMIGETGPASASER